MNTEAYNTTQSLQDNLPGSGHIWLLCTFVKYVIKVIFISILRMDTATALSPGSPQAKCHLDLHQSKSTEWPAILASKLASVIGISC